MQWDEVAASKAPVILDEAQNFPEIFPRIRAAVDQNRKTTGRFLILGSVSPGLMRQVSEFLTGRIAVVELSPLALNELPKKSIDDLRPHLVRAIQRSGLINKLDRIIEFALRR